MSRLLLETVNHKIAPQGIFMGPDSSLSAPNGQGRQARHFGINLTAPFETDRCVT
jgi:hypothetical protein